MTTERMLEVAFDVNENIQCTDKKNESSKCNSRAIHNNKKVQMELSNS